MILVLDLNKLNTSVELHGFIQKLEHVGETWEMHLTSTLSLSYGCHRPKSELPQ
jgi:hypothetical protein